MTPDPAHDLRVVEGLAKRGWYPAKWAHHPQPIKDLIRRSGYRPQVKQCYMNCQRLVMLNHVFGFGTDIELHEGWATHLIPIMHSWLVFEGEVVELTLRPGIRGDVEYVYSHVVTIPELYRHHAEQGMYSPVFMEKLYENNPLRSVWEQLELKT